MGIMDMFRASAPAPAAPAAPATQPTPGNIPPGTPGETPQTADNTTPAQGTESPFAAFTDLWKTDPNATPDAAADSLKIDPQKLHEAASKVDFSKVITEDQLKAIQAGGENATAAFAQAMNKVAQQVYAQSAYASTQLVEQAVKQAKEQFTAQIPSLLKKQQVNASLRDNNKLLSDPAVAPMVQALEHQFVQKFPQATPTEITTMVEDYITNFANIFKKAETGDTTPASGNTGTDIDWEAVFLGTNK